MTKITNNYVLAADIGGTNTRMAVVNENGDIHTLLKKSTYCKEGRDEMISFIVSFAGETIEKSELPIEEICGMGIGFPGPLNAETGTIFNPPNLQGWDSVPLRDILEKELKMPVAIENDANAAALGEWWKGAGSGTGTLFCITLGTGVGGGIILDGKVWHGASSIAGEIGHTTVIRDGIQCTCGNIGCLEAYACSGGILKRVNNALLDEGGNGGLEPLANLKQVDQMIMQGNEIVLNVIRETGVILGIAIANIANLINPEMIVLFGGVTNLGAHLVEPLKEEVKRRAFKKATESLRIELSQLGDNSGTLGAAKNILSKLQN
ncbi:MAG: ROK family protein [Candidatus Scalindua sp.]|jgi:glucokinase|nr:ROK family protein [Candidatus Scalindua sp.]MDV5166867.1 ROK family protein [Candidatus Scalindua sp.]